jgi:hypothetical protein
MLENFMGSDGFFMGNIPNDHGNIMGFSWDVQVTSNMSPPGKFTLCCGKSPAQRLRGKTSK